MSDESASLPGQIGHAVFDIARQAGGGTILAARLARRLFPPRLDGPELMHNLHKMGVRSLPIVAITALFTGAIMVIQAGILVTNTSEPFRKTTYSLERLTAALELGPGLALGPLLAARPGAPRYSFGATP